MNLNINFNFDKNSEDNKIKKAMVFKNQKDFEQFIKANEELSEVLNGDNNKVNNEINNENNVTNEINNLKKIDEIINSIVDIRIDINKIFLNHNKLTETIFKTHKINTNQKKLLKNNYIKLDEVLLSLESSYINFLTIIINGKLPDDQFIQIKLNNMLYDQTYLSNLIKHFKLLNLKLDKKDIRFPNKKINYDYEIEVAYQHNVKFEILHILLESILSNINFFIPK